MNQDQDRSPLADLLRERIAREGPLSFSEVMAAALYDPRYGYYTNLLGFGAHGDFITSPETHPLFGLLIGRQALDVWQALARPRPFRILELGGGSGALAESLIRLVRSEVPDLAYTIEERSPSLKRVQRGRLAGLGVGWSAARQPAHVILANEVLDAQPVHRVVVRDGRLHELRVGIDPAGAFMWVESDGVPPAVAEYFDRLGLLPPEGGVAEVNVGLVDWVQWLAERLERGLALVLDYGYPAEELFRRPQGSLLTYYRHSLGTDPLVRLGQQDISAHVDFTTLASAAHAAGLRVLGVTSQRALLRNLGLDQLQARMRSPTDRQALASLVDARGLGRIGALFLGRGLPDDYVPAGLAGGQPWPEPAALPVLPEEVADADFLDQWREAFPTS